MKHPTVRNIVTGIAAVIACLSTPVAPAQNADEVRQALVNLHDDMKKDNCGDAVGWLYARREQLKNDLLDELFRTDTQGAKAIMFLLFNVPTLEHDERFVNTVMSNLSLDGRYYVGGRTLCDFPSGAGIYRTWEFVDAHFDVFEPRLTQLIGTTNDPWILWAIAWEFKSRKTLDQKIDLFTPEILKKMAPNLVDDKVPSNASQTVRLFLILGDRSEPILREAAQSSDLQARNFGKATLDALKGSHRSFGYLDSKMNITYQLLSLPGLQSPAAPDWLYKEAEPYLFNEKPYP